MSNDEQVPLAREVRIVDEYYSIYHVRFGDRVKRRPPTMGTMNE